MKVYGTVQGVGFRFSARKKARQLGVCGWVRNCDDGCVEMVCEGTPEQVEAMQQWAARGPWFAKVQRVEALEEPAENFSEFEIR